MDQRLSDLRVPKLDYILPPTPTKNLSDIPEPNIYGTTRDHLTQKTSIDFKVIATDIQNACPQQLVQ